MTIRCPECGYENRDMYRFCGMCGATLQRDTAGAPEPPAVTETPAPAPIKVPAAPQATTNPPPASLDYLLEEEPPKSRGKLYLALALLVIAAGVIAWHWESDQRSSAAPAPTSTPTAATAAQTPAPSSNVPPPSPKTEEKPAPKPANPPEAAPPVVAKETAPAPKPSEEADAKPQGTDVKPPAESDTSNDSSTTAEASQPAPAVVPPPPAPKPKPKPDATVATPPAAVLKGDDKLVSEGEKYLYGNGVAEDCDLAQKNLKAAATHSNVHALTLMGAMYATGHCVDRDLPTAYRWFAKALHQDPSNARVQQDLEILWKQMTPGERQLVTKGGG